MLLVKIKTSFVLKLPLEMFLLLLFTDPTVERYVLTFTLRDSPDCFINVSCWGGEQHITWLASQFHIGHVGEIFTYTGLLLQDIVLNSLNFKIKSSKCKF